MKERQPIRHTQGQPELTIKSDSSNLKEGGKVMPDGPVNGPEEQPRGNQYSKEQRRQAKEAYRSYMSFLSGREPTHEEKQTLNHLRETAGIRIFKPSTQEQEIPQGLAIPEGATVRMDTQSGKSYARWATPPDTEIEYEEQLSSEEPAAGGEGGGGEKPPSTPSGQPEEPEGEPSDEDEARFRATKRLDALMANEQRFIQRLGIPEEVGKEIFGDLRKQLAKDLITRELGIGGAEKSISFPQSLEELAELIMKRVGPDWREGGKYALVKDDGSVNTENFLRWARGNILKVHNFNPTSPVNFFSEPNTGVRTEPFGSVISFYEIVFGDNFFLKETKDAEEKTHLAENDEYKALQDQLLMESFLLMIFRNPDIAYTQQRGQKETIFKAIEEALLANPLTRGNFFEFIMSLPSVDKKSKLEEDPNRQNDFQAKRDGNFFVGDGVREALSSYINIFDYGQLRNIFRFAPDSPLFKFSYKDKERKQHTISNPETKAKAYDGSAPATRRGQWFNADGSVKLYKRDVFGKYTLSTDGTGIPHPEYMSYLNVFLNPLQDPGQQADIRERIRLSIMESNGVSHEEATLAELFAYTMTHIHGVAARNDTDSVAFDYLTRLTNLKDYRRRQRGETRGDPWGSKYNFEGFKRIGLTFFEGATDVHGRTIRSLIQGGRGNAIDIKGNHVKNDYTFARDNEGRITFVDPQTGQDVANLYAKNYEPYYEATTDESGKEKRELRFRFKDENGNIVNVGNNVAKTENISFETDLQKQFWPNHWLQGSNIYEFIMQSQEMDFPSMVVEWDNRGNPILDIEKVDKVKRGIEHAVRYMLSTWPKINFAEEDTHWERIEVRNDKGRFIAARKHGEQIGEDGNGNPIYKELELDEDYYILDKHGNKTEERDEPKTYLQSRTMSTLETMFGVDALRFIQYEIEKRGFAKGEKVRTIYNEKGDSVNVDFSKASDPDFRLAVWKGAFDYLVASEIVAHRDRGSGKRYYNYEDIKKVADALRVGEFVTPDQIKMIRKKTRSRARWTYGEELGYAFTLAGFEGFWKVMQIVYKDILSGK